MRLQTWMRLGVGFLLGQQMIVADLAASFPYLERQEAALRAATTGDSIPTRQDTLRTAPPSSAGPSSETPLHRFWLWLKEWANTNEGLITLVSALLAGVAALGRYVWKLWRRRSRTAAKLDVRSAQQRYVEHVIWRHQSLPVAGFETNLRIPIPLEEVYVSLQVQMHETARNSAEASAAGGTPDSELTGKEITAPEALRYALNRRYDGVVILGKPGSGKTTLLKHFLLCFATGTARKHLNFAGDYLPILLYLRDVDPARTIADNILSPLARHALGLDQDFFLPHLRAGRAILLLDGLDEVPTEERRAAVSRWIHDQVHLLFPKCPVLVTSRYSGYRGDAVLAGHYLRLQIQNYQPAQIHAFLRNWLTAVETRLNEDSRQWRQQARVAADDLFARIQGNDTLRALAVNPLMLQIIALVHRDRGTLPERRVELYQECTGVLLERWDKAKGLNVLLSAGQARQLLQPVALWMHSEENRREVSRQEVLDFIAPLLPRVKREVKAEELLVSWEERSGIFKGEGDTFYFHHLSFQEYLTAEEVRNTRQVQLLIRHFDSGWWREPTLLAIGLTNPPIFADFMAALLRDRRSDGGGVEFMLRCLDEALVKDEQPFIAALQHLRRFEALYWSLLALERIGTAAARQAVRNAAQHRNARVAELAQNILARWGEVPAPARAGVKEVLVAGQTRRLPARWFNRIEQNAEYVLIPGGRYRYSVTQQTVEVLPLYFAKYPVTNKLYRRFVDYLAGKGSEEVLTRLPREQFMQHLFARADETEGVVDYLGRDGSKWHEKCSFYQDERFIGDDQPVVGVTWYAAMAYCHWLTELQGASGKGEKATVTYRLPTEEEWEWAAGGGQRKYPWGNEEPNEKRANYGEKVGQTTPVGAYPAGATPEGLQDMAGNVWEWMANWYDRDEDARALRGGAWNDYPENLRCVARDSSDPGYRWNSNGFRVVCAQSAFDTLKL